MITIQGRGVSAGVAAGPLYFYQRAQMEVTRTAVADVDAEWGRFKDAQAKAIDQLGALAEKARAEAGDEAALLFETHQMMAEDLDYEKAIEARIRSGMNAEAVLADMRDHFAGMFASMDNAYMRERAADVKDVSNRIIGILTGAVQSGFQSDVPVILATDHLAPSELVQLDKSKILGIIARDGSSSSHAAILIRTMGIPAIIGAGDQLKLEYAGREVFADGSTGTAVLEPDADTRAYLMKKRDEQIRLQATLNQLKGKENVTKDGRTVRICCNISNPEDIHMVFESDSSGIGLFRSEFLYFECDGFPSEDYQFEAYRKVLSDMGDREVVIRTLDIGADKQIGYLGMKHEENPAMGNRALRFCLSHPKVFHTQLRALYRASAFGNLCIMFPMVTSVWEVREAKRLCGQVQKELDAEGIAYSKNVQLGVMIETPAAALISDRLAKEVDFFSCGTNDLTQYTLACDRQSDDLGRFSDPHHPAVLRLLKMTADNAHKNGIWVGVCGEAGADLRLTETLLAIGVDELSVSPQMVLPLRRKVRETNVAEVRGRILDELMNETTPV